MRIERERTACRIRNQTKKKISLAGYVPPVVYTEARLDSISQKLLIHRLIFLHVLYFLSILNLAKVMPKFEVRYAAGRQGFCHFCPTGSLLNRPRQTDSQGFPFKTFKLN
jgi:hypothetical protein